MLLITIISNTQPKKFQSFGKLSFFIPEHQQIKKYVLGFKCLNFILGLYNFRLNWYQKIWDWYMYIYI